MPTAISITTVNPNPETKVNASQVDLSFFSRHYAPTFTVLIYKKHIRY